MASIFWGSLRRYRARYWFLALAALYVFYCWARDMPLLSSNLPAYTGQHDVGTIDLEVPVTPSRKVGDAINTETGKAAFQVDTVLFSLFYPAVKGAVGERPKHLWVPKPVSLQAEGYARFAHINNWFTNNLFALGLWTLAGSNTVRAEVDVKLHGTAWSSHEVEPHGSLPSDDYGPVSYTHLTLPTKRIV